MFTSLYTQKGFAALIGLLIVMLIIAFLVYGGSFFSKKDNANVYIETEKQAEMQIGEIEKNINKRNLEIKN